MIYFFKKEYSSFKSGFTLIETIIYIGIFVLIISGAVISAYSIIGSSARNQAKAMVQEEGTFLIGKIDWALSGIKNPSISGNGKKLTVTKSVSGLEIILEIDNGKMTIKKGTADRVDLSNSNIVVSCPLLGCFRHIISTGEGINPEKIEANIAIATKTSEGLPFSQDFYTIKYIRK
jgi:hypothetical protein